MCSCSLCFPARPQVESLGFTLIMLSRDVRVDLYCGMFLSIQSWIPYKAFCVPLSVRA